VGIKTNLVFKISKFVLPNVLYLSTPIQFRVSSNFIYFVENKRIITGSSFPIFLHTVTMLQKALRCNSSPLAFANQTHMTLRYVAQRTLSAPLSGYCSVLVLLHHTFGAGLQLGSCGGLDSITFRRRMLR
jgi:hypothetical protein